MRKSLNIQYKIYGRSAIHPAIDRLLDDLVSSLKSLGKLREAEKFERKLTDMTNALKSSKNGSRGEKRKFSASFE